MAVYEYVVLDQRGKQKKGSMEGNNVDKVKIALKGEGLIPLSVNEQSAMNKDIKIGTGVNSRNIAVFCRQFKSLIVAGVPMIQALTMIGDQTENKVLQKAIKNVAVGVEKGDTLAECMDKQEGVFPPILVNMVEAGEASGSLETALERMSEHFDKDAKLKATMRKAMIYPIAVLVVAIGVVIFMMIDIVPQFVDMLKQANTELPAITKMVVGFSNLIVHKWYVFLIVIAGLIGGFIAYRRTESGRYRCSKIALKIPVIGKMILKSSTSRFSRLLGTLMSAGVPLMDAVGITAKVMNNVVLRKALETAREDVARGIPISQSLENSGVFPKMLCNMMKMGEESGNVEDNISKVADYYDEEVENTTEEMTSIMEPIIIVFLALIIGTIVISVLMPMMKLYSSIEKM